MFHTEFFCIVRGLRFFVKYCAAAAGTAPKKIKPAASAGSRAFTFFPMARARFGTTYLQSIAEPTWKRPARVQLHSRLWCDEPVYRFRSKISFRNKFSYTKPQEIVVFVVIAGPKFYLTTPLHSATSSLGRFNENVYVLNTASLQKSEVKKNFIQLLQWYLSGLEFFFWN